MDPVTLAAAKKLMYETMTGAGAIKGDKGDPGDKGDKGDPGSNGATFTPSVSEDGMISWSNDANLPNPPSQNIKGPPGSGSDITPGDGLSKDGDTLSVDNPVRGIMTQAEFDVLTEEQKASGTYFVDDGQSGGSGGEVYDGQEHVIGTWFGKPLYRRVYEATIPAVSSNWTTINAFVEPVTGVMLNSWSINSSNGEMESLPTTAGSGASIAPTKTTFTPGIGIQIYNLGSWYVGRKCRSVLTYTKLTDPEVTT